MARLQALLAGGFSFSSGTGDSQQVFKVSTVGGEVTVPDHIVALEKAKIDRLIADGRAVFVADTSRAGPRVIKVLAAELIASPTPVPLSLQGEPLQSVITAYLVKSDDTLEHLNEGPAADYDLVDGEVFWVGGNMTAHKYAVFFVE